MPSKSEQNSQNISINIGHNAGSIQGVTAGENAYVTQTTVNSETQNLPITQTQAVELLAEIESLIKSLTVPSPSTELAEEAISYTKLAKKEAEKAQPRKKLVIGNLEAATSLIKDVSQTTDAGKELISQLKGPVTKLAGWLGIAAAHFL